MQDIKKCSTWTCTQTITGQLLATPNLFVWLSFQYFFLQIFFYLIKKFSLDSLAFQKSKQVHFKSKYAKQSAKQHIVVLSGIVGSIIRIGESLKNFADLSGALKTLLIVIDEYDEGT